MLDYRRNPAGTATTLSGYNITDAYTKTETDTQIGNATAALVASSQPEILTGTWQIDTGTVGIVGDTLTFSTGILSQASMILDERIDGEDYVLEYEILTYASGDLLILPFNSSPGIVGNTSIGTHTLVYTDGTGANFSIRGSGTQDFSVRIISVKKLDKVDYLQVQEKLLINTDGLPNSTPDHKLQVDGYALHKYGWKDNIQWFSAASGNGTTEPNWQDIGNGLYAYNFTVGEELFVTFHVNHDYALGTKAYPHVHFIVDSTQTAGATVTWRFKYRIARGHSQGDSLTSPTPTNIDMVYTYTGAEVAGEHIVLECSDLQAFDLLEPDTIIMAGCELLAETITGSIYGLCADLHYQSDREVTLNKAPDFNA
jgi:hypothetical protein